MDDLLSVGFWQADHTKGSIGIELHLRFWAFCNKIASNTNINAKETELYVPVF